MSFVSWKDYFDFEREVKFSNRFIYSPEVNNFISNIKNTLPDRMINFIEGGVLYRSQIGYREYESENGPVVAGYDPKRMKPISVMASEGRANPKNIAYLYLSNDENTSLAELRPCKGEYISCAQFRTNRNLKLVDCYSVPEHYSLARCIFGPPQTQDQISYANWSMINDAFTKPVTTSRQSLDYIPTQILSELFKSEGFDGICFKSGMGAGHNFILFNLSDADLINCTVMETKSIQYEFTECTNRYHIEHKK